MTEPDLDLRQQFLNGMSHTACTVNVVTTDGPGGRAGVTVSAMSSVSADTDRPSLLVCVHHKSSAAAAIIENGVFCVNVLRDDQSYISDTFAGRLKTEDGDKFACAHWQTQVTGAPRVVDPLVAFDCHVASSEHIGTHHVFLGEVADIFLAGHGSALIFANRAYGAPARIRPSQSIEDGRARSAQKLAIGCFHTFGPFLLPDLLAQLVQTGSGAEVKLIEGDQRTVTESLLAGDAEIGLLYDIDLPDALTGEPLCALKPYVLLPEHHVLAAKSELTASDLVTHSLVLLDAPPSRDYFMSVFSSQGLEPNVGITSTSFEMVRGLVGNGHGYSLLATKPASAMSYDGKALITRPLRTAVPAGRIMLTHKSGAVLSAPAQQFADLCRWAFAG